MLYMLIIIKQKFIGCLYFVVEENKLIKYEKCIYIRIFLKIRVFLFEDKIFIFVLIIMEDLFLDIVLCYFIQMLICIFWVGFNVEKNCVIFFIIK